MRPRWVVVLGLAAVIVPLSAWLLGGGTARSAPPEATFNVERGDLRVSIVETGSIRSEKPVKITSQLEGQNTILNLIAEGTTVAEGDLIAQLDASRLVENRQQQEITYRRAFASYIQAKEALEIQKRLNESQVKAAELEAEFSAKDLEKYRDGDGPQEKQTAEAEITIAQEELKRALDRAQWSEKLSEKGFISGSELEADRLAVKKREIDLSLAKRKLEVLTRFTQPKELKRLEAEAEESKNELDRVQRRAAAALVQAQADLEAKESTSNLEETRLKKWEDQIAKAVIRAPQAGMVVYASPSEGGRGGGGNQSPIQEGATVRERETIVTLPDLSRMIADTKIHESALDRVRAGQDAIVKIDALPNAPFRGRVTKVALLPDVQQSWLNPDLKVYTTEIALIGDTTALRPGMSCSVEIIVDELEDVLYAPIQCVRTRAGEHTAFVVGEDGTPEKRSVKIGKHNDKLVHLVEGLAEGEVVLLTPPELREQSKIQPRTGEPINEKPDELPPIPPGARLPEVQGPQAGDPADAPGGDKPRPAEGWRERMKNLSPEERERMRGRSRDGQSGPPRSGAGNGDSGGR